MSIAADKLTVGVTYDEAKGYVAHVPDLPTPIIALSLRVLRHRLHEQLIGEDIAVVLQLDRAARLERDRRRRGAHRAARGLGFRE